MKENFFTMTLVSETLLTPHVKHFVFHYDLSEFHYIPGQFITIHFEHAGKLLRRSYSLAAPPDGDTLQFAAGYVARGPASELLFNLKVGADLKTSGPFGRLILKQEETPKRYVLISTSTGVTPYRAMRLECEAFLQNPDRSIVILQGVQHRHDLLYGEEFRALAARYPNFKFYACLSRERENLQAPFEYHGYVQMLFDALRLHPEEDIVYLCGNPGMIDEAFASLKARNFEIKNIRREKYISSN